MPSAFEWPETSVLFLKELLSKGLSYGRIAQELHTTRSAICGKVHRMGLANTRPKTVERMPQGRPSRPAHAASFNAPGKPVDRTALASVAERIAQVSDPVLIDSPGKSFWELADSECRWPLGALLEPAKLFCGLPAVVGRHPYCAQHQRMSYSRSRY